MSKQALTVTIVAATVAWSIGLSALVAPLSARAAVSGGTLVKASLPAVYYVGSDMKRYVFANEKTYKTWYADFSSVMTITDAELASMAIGGNVTYKPGTRMVKITTDPKVYVVDAHGVLRPIASEAVAAALYGSNWNQQIDDVPDAFFTNYTLGSAVNSASDFNRTAVSAAATSINVDKGLGSGSTAAGVSVMKASDSPMGATLPLGAMGVNFLKFSVSNSGSSAASLSSLTLHRSGPGSPADFSAVYLYRGSERLTTGRTFGTSNNDATFSGLNLSIPAGGSVSMWVAADIDADNASVGDVNMISVSSVMVGSSAASGTPVMGSSFSIAGAEVGEVTIEDGTSLSNIKAGGKNQKVATLRITAGGQEDIDLNSLSLTLGGNANRSDLTNFVLKQAGLTIASSSSVTDKDLVVFALSSPMYMEKGAQRNFEVYADLAVVADAGDEVNFYLDEDSDLRATGRTYGYGLQVLNGYTSVDTDSTFVEAGKLTTTFNGPASKDVIANGKDVELFNFTVAAQSNLEFRQMKLVLSTLGGMDVEDVVSDIKVIDTATGGIVAGPKDVPALNDSSSATLTYSETWSLAAGQSRTLKVTADVDVDADGEQIRVTLGDGDVFPSDKVRNLDNSSWLATSDMVPSTALTGNAHNITDSGLTIENASTPVSQTYIKGASNVALAGWTFQAADAAPVRVNSISFVCVADGGGEDCRDVVQTAKLMNGSTQVGSTESPDSDDMISFNSLSLDIAAGQSMTLKLVGTISSSSPTSISVYFDIDDYDVTDADGGDVTVVNNTGSSDSMDIEDSGSVTVARAPSDTDTEEGFVMGGASNAVLAKYKLTAVDEELKLTKARMMVSESSAVSSLMLYDGATLLGTAGVSGSGVANFPSLNMVVPKDSSRTLTVKGALNAVAANGSDPMTDSEVTVTWLIDDTGDTDLEFRGTSAGSSTVITEANDGGTLNWTENDGLDISGFYKSMVKSKPAVTLVGLPTSTLSTGTVVAMRFTVSADAAGDVALGGFVVHVVNGLTTGAIDCAVANPSSVRRVGTGTDIAGSCSGGSIAAAGNGDLEFEFDEEEVIPAGTSRSYDVRLATSDSESGDSMSSFLDDASFLWSDMSLTDHDTDPNDGLLGDDIDSDDWFFGGDYVKVLPTDTQTLSR